MSRIRAGTGAPAPRPIAPRSSPAQAGAPYLEALRDYADREPARLHVPAHKGGTGADAGLVEALGAGALALDLPSLIEGVDTAEDGHAPLQRALDLAAEAWGARRTWFLTGGASQANHAACLALRARGGRVLLQRNVHSSAINAVTMFGLAPAFLAPELDPELGIAHCVTPAVLASALDDAPDAGAVIVVSPTYFGAVADVEGLAEVAHARGLPLIVDEAWGSHLAFHPALPRHALAAGADLVISSPHKTLGSLTGSAMLHLGQRALIEESAVERALSLLVSTSQSSLMLASLDAARRQATTDGRELLERSIEAMSAIRTAVAGVPGLRVLDERRLVGRPGVHGFDPLRLTIDVRGTGLTGYELDRLVRWLDGVELEVIAEDLVVASFGLAEPVARHGARLVEALWAALGESSGTDAVCEPRPEPSRLPAWGKLELSPAEAHFAPQQVIPIERAVGRICGEALAPYPPGIPLALPGERLTSEVLDYLVRARAQGAAIRGAGDPTLETVSVVDQRRSRAASPR